MRQVSLGGVSDVIEYYGEEDVYPGVKVLPPRSAASLTGITLACLLFKPKKPVEKYRAVSTTLVTSPAQR